MQRPAAILFDLDGTLADSAPDFFATVNSLRSEDGLSLFSFDTVRQQVSNGGAALTRLTWDITDDHPQFLQQRQRLLDRYQQLIGSAGGLFPGFGEVLSYFAGSGIPWGVVTNKPRLYTDLLMPKLGVDAAVVICPEDVARRKPAPDPLLKAAAILDVDPQQCWYVGDHIRDIESARAAGMRAIAATFGYIEEDNDPLSWQADDYIASPLELIPLLAQSGNIPA